MILKVVILVLFLVYSAGLFIGGVAWDRKQNPDKSHSMLSALNNPANPSYASLHGSIEGKVTKVDQDKIYIQPSKGGQAIFSLSPQLAVSEFKDGQAVLLGTTKESIRIGDTATITIQGYNNGFAVTGITYAASNTISIPFKEATSSAK